jgi:hypothetical protein
VELSGGWRQTLPHPCICNPGCTSCPRVHPRARFLPCPRFDSETSCRRRTARRSWACVRALHQLRGRPRLAARLLSALRLHGHRPGDVGARTCSRSHSRALVEPALHQASLRLASWSTVVVIITTRALSMHVA